MCLSGCIRVARLELEPRTRCLRSISEPNAVLYSYECAKNSVATVSAMLPWDIGPLHAEVRCSGMTLSLRQGLSQPEPVQLDSMDSELRNSLWNVVCEHFFQQPSMFGNDIIRFPSPGLRDLCRAIWRDHLKRPVYELESWWTTYSVIHQYFEQAMWNEVYDFVQFLVTEAKRDDWSWDVASYELTCNKVLCYQAAKVGHIGSREIRGWMEVF